MTSADATTSSIDLAGVWCAIPVYNNAATITDVAQRARAQIANVLVVDDGSTDADLRELLKSLSITVIRHDVNRGKGAALLTAFKHVVDRGGRYVITLDGDGQHFPEDIPRFLFRLAPSTILIGHRSEITGTMPPRSTFGRDFSDFWIYIESGVAVRDTQSGFRAYPLPDVLQLRCGARHYNFEMEIITRAMWAGLNADPVPIRVWYPNAAERVSSFDPVRDNWRISKIHLRLVLRQLMPWPHRKFALHRPPHEWLSENLSPLGISLAAAAGILPSVVLWPYGGLLAMYIALRLHLNKLHVVGWSGLLLLPAVPDLCQRVGRATVGDGSRLQWFVGSHLVAFTMLMLVIVATYTANRRERTAV